MKVIFFDNSILNYTNFNTKRKLMERSLDHLIYDLKLNCWTRKKG